MMLCLATAVLTGALAVGVVIWTNTDEDPVRAESRSDPAMASLPLQEPSVEGKAEVNLPVTKQTSKPVKADNLEFQIVSSTIWPMPDRIGKGPPEIPAGESPVQLQLRVTNHGQKEVRLLSIVGTPILQAADGKELPGRMLGSIHSRLPKLISLDAGKTVTFKRFSQLSTYRTGSSLRLVWEDEFGMVSEIEGLKPGKYLLRLQYNTQRYVDGWTWVKESGAWFGDVRTAVVSVEIVDAKASPPAVSNGVEAMSLPDGTWQLQKAEELGWKDPIEVVALAGSTWQVPAARKQTQVCLGFRMTTVEKWWVRIIPSMAMVSIKSADGVELPSRKTGATVSVDAPQLLALEPRFSQSVANPAILFHAGKTLTLAWADGGGNVWHVDNLKPGRYSVRYLIRTEKGEPSQYISYWLGEIQTETVMFEIKE
jgi:hypothetical protein